MTSEDQPTNQEPMEALEAVLLLLIQRVLNLRLEEYEKQQNMMGQQLRKIEELEEKRKDTNKRVVENILHSFQQKIEEVVKSYQDDMLQIRGEMEGFRNLMETFEKKIDSFRAMLGTQKMMGERLNLLENQPKKDMEDLSNFIRETDDLMQGRWKELDEEMKLLKKVLKKEPIPKRRRFSWWKRNFSS